MKKDSASEQNIIRNAAQSAVKAAFYFGITITRSYLKKRLHRTPTEQKVSANFQSWVMHGNFIEFANERMNAIMRDIESQLGKPSRDWSHDELLQAYRDVEKYFLVFTESYERPRGCPRRQRKSRGIIENAMRDGAVKRQKQRKEELKRIENLFNRRGDILRLGKFAKKESDQLIREGNNKADADIIVGSLDAAFCYMRDADMISQEEFKARIIPDEVRELRLPRGFFQYILKDLEIDPKNENAFKMRISRSRRRS